MRVIVFAPEEDAEGVERKASQLRLGVGQGIDNTLPVIDTDMLGLQTSGGKKKNKGLANINKPDKNPSRANVAMRLLVD